jgi:hypothetical protein
MSQWLTTTSISPRMVGTTFDTATTALATECIVDAQNEVVRQLSKVYDFSDTIYATTTTRPPVLDSISKTLAVGYMYENMSRGSKEGNARADKFIKRAMDQLKDLRELTVLLVDPNGAVVDPSTDQFSTHSNTVDYAPTFNEDDPKNWRVDSTKLEDIADERD